MDSIIISSHHINTQSFAETLRSFNIHAQIAGSLNNALEIITQRPVNAIFIPDSQDSKAMRSAVSQLRNSAQRYPYIISLSDNAHNRDESAGENICIASSEITPETIATISANLNRLNNLMAVIGNNSIDFPSAGGIIARSAFNQLFLSALDRSNRYSEQSAIINISLDNYSELFDIGGNYIADYALATLSKKIALIRRQTDIVGQIESQTYSLLLQTPKNAQEPIYAAKRFAETLSTSPELAQAAPVPMRISITLTAIPTGTSAFEETITTTAQTHGTDQQQPAPQQPTGFTTF